jgi:hypothetical protein
MQSTTETKTMELPNFVIGDKEYVVLSKEKLDALIEKLEDLEDYRDAVLSEKEGGDLIDLEDLMKETGIS